MKLEEFKSLNLQRGCLYTAKVIIPEGNPLNIESEPEFPFIYLGEVPKSTHQPNGGYLVLTDLKKTTRNINALLEVTPETILNDEKWMLEKGFELIDGVILWETNEKDIVQTIWGYEITIEPLKA